MNLIVKTKINWTRSAIALALMCAVFSFSAMAQDSSNKPLDEETVAQLVEELTDGLSDLIEDEDQVTAIVEKWDEREDLTGKTKAQILNFLFADVRSIVKDKKTQDSILAGWKESASNNTEVGDSDANTNKQPVAPVIPSTQVAPQPVKPVTREFSEPYIDLKKDELEPVIIKAGTVAAAAIYTIEETDPGQLRFFGNYIAEIYEAAQNCEKKRRKRKLPTV